MISGVSVEKNGMFMSLLNLNFRANDKSHANRSLSMNQWPPQQPRLQEALTMREHNCLNPIPVS